MGRAEVFIVGCPLCDEAVKKVKEVACDSCDVTVSDLRGGCATSECRDRAKRYGVMRVPTVAVDGRILSCCETPVFDADALRASGIGKSD
jgi:hypothetical protein